MNRNSTLGVVVEAVDDQVVAHVGLHALGRFAERLGFGARLSERIGWAGGRGLGHDRGTVLVQAMLMLAGVGESCADIEHLRGQSRPFGPVASAPTLYRTFREIDAETLEGLWAAVGETRAWGCARSAATTGIGPVVLEIDASLVEIHSENKAGTGSVPKQGSRVTAHPCANKPHSHLVCLGKLRANQRQLVDPRETRATDSPRALILADPDVGIDPKGPVGVGMLRAAPRAVASVSC